MQELGIVLKRFLPFKQKVSALTRELGKINLISQPVSKCNLLWPGMIFSFNLNNCMSKNNIIFATDINILLTIQANQKLDLQWVHQCLEFCYYFVPLNSPDFKLFIHLYNCLKIQLLFEEFNLQLCLIKKIFLLKLLELSGFHPKKQLLQYLNIYEDLSELFVDFGNKQKVEFLKSILNQISEANITQIDSWLLYCIKNHPNFRFFKTI